MARKRSSLPVQKTLFFFSLALLFIIITYFWLATTKNNSTNKGQHLTITSPNQEFVAGQSSVFEFETDLEDLVPHHERKYHTLIASENFDVFGHIHPEDFETDNAVEVAFPRSGKYILGLDALSSSIGAINTYKQINVTGVPPQDTYAQGARNVKCFVGVDDAIIIVSETEVDCPGGYTVTMTQSADELLPDSNFRLEFNIKQLNTELTDLEPYLGAALHLAVVPADLADIYHFHGDVKETPEYFSWLVPNVSAHGGSDLSDQDDSDLPENFGPDLVSEAIELSEPGIYKVFAQFKHGGKIVTANFDIEVNKIQ